MQSYKNIGGGSGVTFYESGPDFIKIYFIDGSIYLYNNAVTEQRILKK